MKVVNVRQKGCETVRERLLLIIGSVWLSAVVGVIIFLGGSTVNDDQHTYDFDHSEHEHDHGMDYGFRMILNSLDEEMWLVDAVIYGTVLRQGKASYRQTIRDRNIVFNSPVIGSTILVKEVVYGEVNGDKITFLQHSLFLEEESSSLTMSEGEEYILFLKNSTRGFYWPYDLPPKAIWNVEGGFVSGRATDENFTHLNNLQINEFMKAIKKAGENKKKPDWVVEE